MGDLEAGVQTVCGTTVLRVAPKDGDSGRNYGVDDRNAGLDGRSCLCWASSLWRKEEDRDGMGLTGELVSLGTAHNHSGVR